MKEEVRIVIKLQFLKKIIAERYWKLHGTNVASDDGDEVVYTGSGGRNLKSGNKRTSKEQQFDQQLTGLNLALAKSCVAQVNDVDGATAADEEWKKGKPVRLVRTAKFGTYSRFAPPDGCRYDGIYKVVSYWPEKRAGAGMLVWKFRLRRDDVEPAPWTEEGKTICKEKGYHCIYPAESEEEDVDKDKIKSPDEGPNAVMKADGEDSNKKGESQKGTEKEKVRNVDENGNIVVEQDVKKTEPEVKEVEPKSEAGEEVTESEFRVRFELRVLILGDERNLNLWQGILAESHADAAAFLGRVRETFECLMCGLLARDPVGPGCAHIMCKSCLEGVVGCPFCGKRFRAKMKEGVNGELRLVLRVLFPGYDDDEE